jgi:hypothetical protein
MPEITFSRVAKFLLLCFVVGFFLTEFGISPTEFWHGIVDLVKYTAEHIRSIFGWGFIYILAGAAIVVPVYLLVLLKRYLSGKK